MTIINLIVSNSFLYSKNGDFKIYPKCPICNNVKLFVQFAKDGRVSMITCDNDQLVIFVHNNEFEVTFSLFSHHDITKTQMDILDLHLKGLVEYDHFIARYEQFTINAQKDIVLERLKR